MTPKLTADQRDAIVRSAGQPVKVEDGLSHEVFFLVSAEALPSLWDEYIRREVHRGLDQVDRGETVPWDIESVLREAHALHAKSGI